ncbi:hypothetical protein [Psychrobacillus sp.]|uniref:hypothetical protein n=1 Tax=Psychrobacillus sp. TaxID=1871623 RepID=UPI0028BDD179|nr:hypothetical protein [Psychrobacillus sp.]
MLKHKNIALLMIFSIIFFFSYSPATSYACSCIAPPSAQEELASSSAVFTGKVIDMLDVNKHNLTQSSADPIAFLFEVDEAWKGVTQSQVVVSTERDSASCGFPFTVNNEYLVYAQEIDGELKGTICSRTTDLASAVADIEALGLGDKPIEQVSINLDAKPLEEDAPAVMDYAVYLIVLLVVLLLASIYFIRRAKKQKRVDH